MSGGEIAIGRVRIFVRSHWRLKLWRHRFFWLSVKPYQAGVVCLILGVEVTVHRVRPE